MSCKLAPNSNATFRCYSETTVSTVEYSRMPFPSKAQRQNGWRCGSRRSYERSLTYPFPSEILLVQPGISQVTAMTTTFFTVLFQMVDAFLHESIRLRLAVVYSMADQEDIRLRSGLKV